MTPHWQTHMQNAIRDVSTLLEALQLSPVDFADAPCDSDFSILVTPHMLSQMAMGDPHDPLLHQVLPRKLESESHPGYTTDPVAESQKIVGPGLIHKYHGRLLVVTTGACAVHCRYCFRRHFPYESHQVRHSQIDKTIEVIKNDPTISEVILSGGDPLMLTDDHLRQWQVALNAIDHVKRVRFHTRVPSVLPERLTESLLNVLQGFEARVVMVTHINHPNEVDDVVKNAIRSCQGDGVTWLNQTVFLKGVNDQADTLIALCERVFEAGVLPYYVHLLDPVAGAHHYEVDANQAIDIQTALRRHLPGYLMPRFVREDPDKPYKLPL